MNTSRILLYDGSFNGYLTAVFVAFTQKIEIADIQKESNEQRGLFFDAQIVYTDIDKAKRVWNGVEKKSLTAIKNIYFAFLSESKGIELLIYRYIQRLFSKTEIMHLNFSDDTIFKIGMLSKLVAKEKQRTESSIKFQLTKDEIHYVVIEPENNILPLISKHFKNSYPDQQWIIFDAKRNYGIYYNWQSVELVTIDFDRVLGSSALKNSNSISSEYHIKDSWNHFFKSNTIQSCITKKEYIQNVPKQQWNYLNEQKAV